MSSKLIFSQVIKSIILVFILTLSVLFNFILSVSLANAEVFYAQDEAMKIAFPDADEVKTKTLFIQGSNVEHIEKLSRAKVDSGLFTFFVAYKNGAPTGYAAIGSNIVRTYPQTYMVVLNPDGSVKTTLILAFHEPLDYLPTDKWLEQFKEKDIKESIRPGDDIAGILGSSLSVNAVSAGVRKVLAVYDTFKEQLVKNN